MRLRVRGAVPGSRAVVASVYLLLRSRCDFLLNCWCFACGTVSQSDTRRVVEHHAGVRVHVRWPHNGPELRLCNHGVVSVLYLCHQPSVAAGPPDVHLVRLWCRCAGCMCYASEQVQHVGHGVVVIAVALHTVAPPMGLLYIGNNCPRTAVRMGCHRLVSGTSRASSMTG